MFEQYENFILIKDLPDKSVPVGTTGVVLEVYKSDPIEYEVEFPSEDGTNLGKDSTYTLSEVFMGKGA